MNRHRLVLSFLLALLLLPSEALAVWRQIDSFYFPLSRVVLKDQSLPSWKKEAYAWAQGGTTAGDGRAFAVSPGISVTWTAAPENGLATEFWLHFPPGVGEVEVVARAEIRGWAEAKGPGEGKAAAFGFAEASFFIDGVPTIVLVSASAAVASSPVQGLPSFRISVPLYPAGPSIAYSQEVVFRNGSGRVPDGSRGRRFRVACPVGSFEILERSGATVYVWALGSGTGKKGSATCEIEGEGVVTFSLLTHQQCPTQP